MGDAESNGLFVPEKVRWRLRASDALKRLDQVASPFVAIEPVRPSSSSPVVESLAATLSDSSLAD